MGAMVATVVQQLTRVLLSATIVLVCLTSLSCSVLLREGCENAKPFAPCTPKNTTRFTGSCLEGMCYIRDAVHFKFRVTAKYWPRRIDKDIRDLWIRGKAQGLGLSWDSPVKMTPTGMSGVWAKDFSYKIDPQCGTLPTCPSADWSFELRVFRGEEEGEMLGPNLFQTLPLTGSVSGVRVVTPPVVEVCPWFHGTRVAVQSQTITVPPQLLGGTGKVVPYEFVMIYPPSFEDNAARNYPLVLVVGRNVTTLAATSIEHAMVGESSMREAFILGLTFPVGDACSILPYVTKEFVCKEGLCGQDCQTCRSPDRGKPCSKGELQKEMEKCGRVRWCGGQANVFIDLIDHHIIPHVVEITENRIDTHSPVSLVGYRHGGLFACYAGIKRPDLFSNVACLSPSLYMPYLDTSESYFIQELQSAAERMEVELLLSPELAHMSQTFYIDFGSKDSFHYPLYNARDSSTALVNSLVHRMGMTINKNVFFREFPGHSAYVLSDEADLAYFHRLLEPLKLFLASEGGIGQSKLLPLESLDEDFNSWGGVFHDRIKEVHIGQALLQHPDLVAGAVLDIAADSDTKVSNAEGSAGPVPSVGGPQCLQDKHITLTILLASLGVTAFVTAILSILCICMTEQARGAMKRNGGVADSEEEGDDEGTDESGDGDVDDIDERAEERP